MRTGTTKLLLGIAAGVTALGLLGAAATAQESGPKPGRDGARVAGKVTSIEGNTFGLQTRRHGEIRVQFDAQTRWFGGSESDLKVGKMVGAAGKLTNQVLHADRIALTKPDGAGRIQRHVVRGEVTAVDGHTFTMRTRVGEVRVTWDENTRFRNGAAGDLVVGARVAVVGKRAGEAGTSALHALGIGFLTGERPAQP